MRRTGPAEGFTRQPVGNRSSCSYVNTNTAAAEQLR